MVAKKTGVPQSASGRSTAAGASGGTADTGTGKKAAAKAATAKAAARKKAAGEAAGGKAVVRKAAAGEEAAGKGVTAREGAGGAASPAGADRRSTAKKAGAAQAAETTGATTVVAKKSPGTATAAQKPTAVPKARAGAAAADELAVRPGEDPWSPEEVAEARTELESEALRLRSELDASEQALAGLMRDSGDGAGDDQADTGAKNITREHEMSLAQNSREMLEQTERALERLATGTYGLCENCGEPIGKARMQAFPRATLCVACKQKQERRY
ncbi:TraR/DksA family transcriptional regulator [Streptomyces sp. CRN 30]|uniref:TraR/DksA family transcriptional regulator n=1 Tax=Streptomyces sp. CRN 30 TaxID=3075613 RepID=UPI002A81E3EF|nr:TraR/DksA C4-type zinc finger protein [Streptomyces sp. CRN 30]